MQEGAAAANSTEPDVLRMRARRWKSGRARGARTSGLRQTLTGASCRARRSDLATAARVSTSTFASDATRP